MDLKSDLPFWIVRNGLERNYPPLEQDVRCDALVIGGGVSGALLAHRLTRKGVDCVVVDRRHIAWGSTSASTALLQYEIDTPLRKLREQVGSSRAERAYWLGIESIGHLQKLAGRECGFAIRPSLQIAAKVADVRGLQKEQLERAKLGMPTTFLDRQELRAIGIHASGALRSTVAAEVDPYLLTHRLFRLASAAGARIFDRTTALHYENTRIGVTVATDRGSKIRCKAVFFASGYETSEILPKNIVTFQSTYAFVSEPVEDLTWWKDRTLIWSTGNPYLYMRTTNDHRILVGGEDDNILQAERRDRRIAKKTRTLARRFNSVFPKRMMEPAFGWAGVFGSTKDGLAYIGTHPAFPRAYFGLGYGGNGVTFSEIASRILTDLFLGKKNTDVNVFTFDR